MKKKLCLFLLLALLLTGCAQVSAESGPVRESANASAAGDMEPTEIIEETEPATEETEAPDAGIGSVTITIPDCITVTPDTQNGPLAVSFEGVDPTGAPAGGRICTLELLRGEEIIGNTRTFALRNGAMVPLPLDYSFARYQPDSEDTLTIRLCYREETVEQTVAVRLENWPDEVYAEQSGDKRPYYIDVLRNENVVIVYGKDEAGEYTQIVHVFLCSTGTATPSGRYSLGAKTEWNALFGGVYGQYAIRVVGNILFHSVPYYRMSKDRLESEEFNKLGTAASMGCIRMAVADVKWIYDHCPAGTKVHIYDVEELPVEKPAQILIDLEDPRAGWDPTDPDPDNPWNSNP